MNDELLKRYPILSYFKWEHLPPRLQLISQPFADLAAEAAQRYPDGHAETAAGLHKLLEAKDCFVRAAL